jgi:hypothetical protein
LSTDIVIIIIIQDATISNHSASTSVLVTISNVANDRGRLSKNSTCKDMEIKTISYLTRNNNISLVCMPSSTSDVSTIDDSVVQWSYDQQCMAYNAEDDSDEDDESNHLDTANNEPNPNPRMLSNTIDTTFRITFLSTDATKG